VIAIARTNAMPKHR